MAIITKTYCLRILFSLVVCENVPFVRVYVMSHVCFTVSHRGYCGLSHPSLLSYGSCWQM